MILFLSALSEESKITLLYLGKSSLRVLFVMFCITNKFPEIWGRINDIIPSVFKSLSCKFGGETWLSAECDFLSVINVL